MKNAHYTFRFTLLSVPGFAPKSHYQWLKSPNFIHSFPTTTPLIFPSSLSINLSTFIPFVPLLIMMINKPWPCVGEKACIIQFTDEMGQHLKSAWYTHCTYLTAPAVYLTSQVKFLHLVLLSWQLLMFIKWIQSTGKNPVLNVGGEPNPYPPR